MQTPTSLQIWLSEQATPLFCIFAFVMLVLFVLMLSARRRRIQLNRLRSDINEETFAETLELHGFDPELSRTVYRYLQEKQNVHFPIQPGDLLDEDLGLDLVDVEQTVREVFQLTRRTYKPGLRHMPLITVEDLVRFVQASPRMFAEAA